MKRIGFLHVIFTCLVKFYVTCTGKIDGIITMRQKITQELLWLALKKKGVK